MYLRFAQSQKSSGGKRVSEAVNRSPSDPFGGKREGEERKRESEREREKE